MDAYVTGGSTAPDLRLGLLKTLASHANVPDLNTVADMEAHADFAELTVAGYARVALTTEAVTEVDASDWALLDCDDVAFAALTTGETIIGAFLYNHNGGADSSRDVLVIYDLTSTPTNGGAVTVTTASGAVRGQ
jgi:hypothetical protein